MNSSESIQGVTQGERSASLSGLSVLPIKPISREKWYECRSGTAPEQGYEIEKGVRLCVGGGKACAGICLIYQVLESR